MLASMVETYYHPSCSTYIPYTYDACPLLRTVGSGLVTINICSSQMHTRNRCRHCGDWLLYSVDWLVCMRSVVSTAHVE